MQPWYSAAGGGCDCGGCRPVASDAASLLCVMLSLIGTAKLLWNSSTSPFPGAAHFSLAPSSSLEGVCMCGCFAALSVLPAGQVGGAFWATRMLLLLSTHVCSLDSKRSSSMPANEQGLHLYTAGTPNGAQGSVAGQRSGAVHASPGESIPSQPSSASPLFRPQAANSSGGAWAALHAAQGAACSGKTCRQHPRRLCRCRRQPPLTPPPPTRLLPPAAGALLMTHSLTDRPGRRPAQARVPEHQPYRAHPRAG